MSSSLRVWLLLSCVVPMAIGSGCVATYASQPPQHSTRLTFYEVLSPYGEWFDVPPYGPVWRPHRHFVGVEFTPYVTGGRWVYTEYGWIFDTDWDWGWVPFHYGRWLYLGAVEGWVWVPDTVWGPAWVEWRAGGGYVGWVPLPPANVSVVIGVYEPRWIWVGVHHFQNGQHHGHVVFEPGVHPATAVIPPRPARDGHAWYVGPSPDWVSHEASVPVTPRRYAPPEPLPPGVLDTPKDSRRRSVPPRGQPASEWGHPSESPHPATGNPPPRTGWGPPPGEPASPRAAPPPSTPRVNPSPPPAGSHSPAQPGTAPGHAPPAGREHGTSQPPASGGPHGASSPPPGRPARGTTDPR